MLRFPSPLIQVEIQAGSGSYPIQLPSQELFRVDHIFKHQEYSIPNHLLPDRALTVVDIGANVGLFTLYIRLLRAGTTIHCFEPVPGTLALLKVNLNGMQGVHVHPYGLSNTTGRTAMHLHPYNTGENSLKPTSTQSGQLIEIEIQDAEAAFRRIQLNDIDILKIDTEGCEVEILESLHSRLECIGIILLEYHSEADRRRIDQLLDNFVLFEACVARPGLGLLKYANPSGPK